MSKQFETVAKWLDKLHYAETDETNNKTDDIVECCEDDRFELIAKAKAELLDATNVESNPTDMAALDSILFRCWQMGWLDRLRDAERTCHNVTDEYWLDDERFECSECGAWMYLESESLRTCSEGHVNYCYNCGARVEVGE